MIDKIKLDINDVVVYPCCTIDFTRYKRQFQN